MCKTPADPAPWRARTALGLIASASLAAPSVAFSAAQEPAAAGSDSAAPTEQPAAAETAPPVPLERLDGPALERVLGELVSAWPQRAKRTRFGTCEGGAPLWLLEVLGPDAAPDAPALLVVAALEGERLFETSLAVELARAALEGAWPEVQSQQPPQAADENGDRDAEPTPDEAPAPEATDLPSPEALAAWRSVRLLIVPRADPDGAAWRLASPGAERLAALPGSAGSSLDIDRDGSSAEDPPADVDGDGRVLWMRYVDRAGGLRQDEDEPRLLRSPRAELGETGRLLQVREGRDNDGDQRASEDGGGLRRLSAQFPSDWPEHSPESGDFAGQAPEARALMDLVLEHPEIWAALVIDSYDTLVDPKEAQSGGRLPAAGYLAGDLPWVKELSKTYRAKTGIEARPAGDSAGRFERWLYEQQGILTLGVRVFDLPEEAAPKAAKEAKDSGEAKADDAAPAPEADDQEPDKAAAQAPADPARGARRAGGRRPGGPAAGGRAPAKPSGSKDAEFERERKQLAWIDAHPEEAWRFVPYAPFEHPQLGAVEIGGWAAYARLDPPAGEEARLAQGFAAFLAELSAAAPHVDFGELSAKALGAGLYELEIELVDAGRAPLPSAAAKRSRNQMPGWLRIELPVGSSLIAGELENRFDSLDEPGRRLERHLWIAGQPNQRIQVSVETQNAGVLRREVTLP